MPYSWIFIILILVAISFFYGGSSLADPFPRHTSLPVFNPHRTSFTCAIEAAVLPPIDPEADEWFYEGMALTSTEKWEEDIDYARAAMLWTKASERGHWKAQYNLAELYINGDGVPQNFEKALLLIEEGMKQGIPSAWDRMGSLYGEGMPGFQSSATLAWAFWQRAADMGSAAAQAYIGSHLDAVDDDPKTLYWANQVIALQMMECAYAQAHGRGAYDLALTYIFADTPRKNEALAALQNGVRWGGGDSARRLWINFGSYDPINGAAPFADIARAQRYEVFYDALDNNPDLRFPNLDRVLPLPSYDLPAWNGDKKALLEAAKPIELSVINASSEVVVSWRSKAGITRQIARTTPINIVRDAKSPTSGVWQPVLTDAKHPLFSPP